MKTKLLSLALLCFMAFAIMGSDCSNSGGEYTDGKYDDPDRVTLIDDKYSDTDMKMISKKMVESMSSCAAVTNFKGRKPPVLIIHRVKNKSLEHIDMDTLTAYIRTAVLQRGTFAFVDKERRGTLEEERKYDRSGRVDKKTVKADDKQVSPDFVLSGEFSSIEKNAGKIKQVYYIIFLRLTDRVTNLVIWEDKKEIKKHFKRRRVKP